MSPMPSSMTLAGSPLNSCLTLMEQLRTSSREAGYVVGGRVLVLYQVVGLAPFSQSTGCRNSRHRTTA